MRLPWITASRRMLEQARDLMAEAQQIASDSIESLREVERKCEAATAERDRLREDFRRVNSALQRCTTLAGQTGSAAVVELVRDHDELEMRIEAVLTMRGYHDPANAHTVLVADEVVRLLRGGKRVPDDAREITDGS